jgi:hypothetical protein
MYGSVPSIVAEGQLGAAGSYNGFALLDRGMGSAQADGAFGIALKVTNICDL